MAAALALNHGTDDVSGRLLQNNFGIILPSVLYNIRRDVWDMYNLLGANTRLSLSSPVWV